MRTSDFDYELPAERVAAFPDSDRDGSRLLVLPTSGQGTLHVRFRKIADHLPRSALVVLNDARVIPARLRGHKASGGAVELLVTRCISDDEQTGESEWEGIGRNLGSRPVGSKIALPGGAWAEIQSEMGSGSFRIHLSGGRPGESSLALLERIGELPLPPYVEARRKQAVAAGVVLPELKELDRDRYQTVYAAAPGAIAAPTAGLHFTKPLLAEIAERGHRIARLTLHVGVGTFRPVKVDDPDRHEMEPETYTIPPETADAVAEARQAGRPVLAVGTTVVRALESAARAGAGSVRVGTASTRLFLRPGDTFHVVTDLVTNFHLPRSTLLMLVAAFAGRDRVLGAYAEAISAGYRFYSYGDAMLIRRTP